MLVWEGKRHLLTFAELLPVNMKIHFCVEIAGNGLRYICIQMYDSVIQQ